MSDIPQDTTSVSISVRYTSSLCQYISNTVRYTSSHYQCISNTVRYQTLLGTPQTLPLCKYISSIAWYTSKTVKKQYQCTLNYYQVIHLSNGYTSQVIYSFTIHLHRVRCIDAYSINVFTTHHHITTYLYHLTTLSHITTPYHTLPHITTYHKSSPYYLTTLPSYYISLHYHMTQ